MALTDKQKKILQYLKRNLYSTDEIAEKVGCSYDYIEKCLLGNSEIEGIKEFQDALRKVDEHVNARIQRRTINAKELLIKRLESWVKHELKGAPQTVSQHKQLVESIQVLKKEIPDFNITSYTWKEGMSMEEALDEYKRLTALAKLSSERRRISELGTGGSAEVFGINGSLNTNGKDAQGPVIPPVSETGAVSQE